MPASHSIIRPIPEFSREGSVHATPWFQLAGWINDIASLIRKVERDFRPGPVHDLRVTLRRCRSAASGFEQFDPSPTWLRFRKDTKRLLGGLGDLRDVQVMRVWVAKLRMSKTESGKRLLEILSKQEERAVRRAGKELKAFDRKVWRKWARNLPERASRIPSSSPALELLVLQRWMEAHKLHIMAMKLRSKISFHRLRIGIKGFRYSVECFLPARHPVWGGELKRLQDLLGKVHDLDVLWEMVVNLKPGIPLPERRMWRLAIAGSRSPLLASYRKRTTGSKSRWETWRAELPAGEALRRSRLEWLAVWASFLDPAPDHSRLVAQLAMRLFEGLRKAEDIPSFSREAGDLLEAAAILSGVGRAKGDRHYQKNSFRIIRRQIPPPGWSRIRMARIACIVRLHRGSLPSDKNWNGWSGVSESEREGLKFLGGILRLATSFASSSEPRIESVGVAQRGDSLVIQAIGYRAEEPLASHLAGARHLLESVIHKAVVIEPAGQL